MSTPEKAFILAAGYGTRMRPLTDTCPKPLLKVAGKPLLTHICDRLSEAGVKQAVVNTHYLPEKVQDWTKTIDCVDITLSYEDPVLDTGGGVKNVIDFYGDDPFYVIAGDSFWVDRDTPILTDLATQWRDDMDILIGLKRSNDMHLTSGLGDYDIDENGWARRSLNKSGTHMFTNIRINHPRIYKDAPDGAYSFLRNLDECEAEGTLYGYDYQGDWHHISTPDDLITVNEALAGGMLQMPDVLFRYAAASELM